MYVYVMLWILFGALAGWVASIFVGVNESRGFLTHVLVGIVGAVSGGLMAEMLDIYTFHGFSLAGLMAAVAGSVLMLICYRRSFAKGQNNSWLSMGQR